LRGGVLAGWKEGLVHAVVDEKGNAIGRLDHAAASVVQIVDADGAATAGVLPGMQ